MVVWMLILGLMGGAVVGVLATCLCVVAGRDQDAAAGAPSQRLQEAFGGVPQGAA